MKRTAGMRAVRLASIATILCVYPTFARAQTPPAAGGGAAAADDAEWRRHMENRMEQLEQENATLRKEVGQVAETKQAVADDAASRGAMGTGAAPGVHARAKDTTPPDFDT